MATIHNQPAPLAHLPSYAALQKDTPRAAVQGAAQHANQPAQGALAGRQVAVGDGQQGREARSLLSSLKTGLLRLGQGALLIATLPLTITAGVGLGLMALGKKLGEAITGVSAEARNQRREGLAEQRFIDTNRAMVTALRTPQPPSIGANTAVMDRLQAHAQLTGKNMGGQELKDLVVAGENIARALQEPANAQGRSPLTVSIGGQQHQVASNAFTTRALAWYMMASAASQDVLRNNMDDTSTSDMTTSGAFIMKDPGNRIYHFLNDAPTAGARMSTHFEERLGHDREHYLLGFVPTFGSKPAQRGIEDYQARMPGQGGTMLFDKLKPDASGRAELFVKFESAGCPPYFSSESHHSTGDRALRFFAALDRNLHHCVSFNHSRGAAGAGPAPTAVVRQEHMYKGTLANAFSAVKDLFAQAESAGIVRADDASGVAKSMKKFGVGAGLVVAQEIRARANAQGDALLETQAASVASHIQDEMARLGLASDRWDIERRGAEVHISLDPAQVTT